MAWLARRQTGFPAAVPAPVPDPAPATAQASAAAAATEGLLGQWLALSELERVVFLAMAREVTGSSSVVERSAIDLSQRFQALADGAKAQLARVDAVIAAARSIKVGDGEVTLNEATDFIGEVLKSVIDTVLGVSKNAMRMVYSLNDISAEVEASSKCVLQLRKINQQISFLAINTSIEAARADRHGSAFHVIAEEIRNLSKDTDATVASVGNRIDTVVQRVKVSHEVMREIATIDMSRHIMAKDRMDALLGGMIEQGATFNAILAETAAESSELAATIARLVMGLQFQDRISQHLAHVVEALATLGEAGEALRRTTHEALPDAFTEGEVSRAWLDKLVEKQTLGAVRKRFLAALLDDPVADGDASASAAEATRNGGDIDLF